MATAGYAHVTQVVSPGEYSVRGGLIDLFPMGSPLPTGSTCSAMKWRASRPSTSIASARCTRYRKSACCRRASSRSTTPAAPVFASASAKSSRATRRNRASTATSRRTARRRPVSNTGLPLFFEETATLVRLPPEDAVLCLHGDVHAAIRASGRIPRPVTGCSTVTVRAPAPRPASCSSEEQFFVAAKPHARIDMPGSTGTTELAAGPTQALPPVAVDAGLTIRPLALWPFSNTTPAASSARRIAGRRETLTELAEPNTVSNRRPLPIRWRLSAEGTKLGLGVRRYSPAFQLAEIAFVTEAELFAGSPSARAAACTREAQRKAWSTTGSDLTELVGDPVVHEQHGIGRYQGLIHMDPAKATPSSSSCDYANEAKLYVPVSSCM